MMSTMVRYGPRRGLDEWSIPEKEKAVVYPCRISNRIELVLQAQPRCLARRATRCTERLHAGYDKTAPQESPYDGTLETRSIKRKSKQNVLSIVQINPTAAHTHAHVMWLIYFVYNIFTHAQPQTTV
jgi:hypothetical protein